MVYWNHWNAVIDLLVFPECSTKSPAAAAVPWCCPQTSWARWPESRQLRIEKCWVKLQNIVYYIMIRLSNVMCILYIYIYVLHCVISFYPLDIFWISAKWCWKSGKTKNFKWLQKLQRLHCSGVRSIILGDGYWASNDFLVDSERIVSGSRRRKECSGAGKTLMDTRFTRFTRFDADQAIWCIYCPWISMMIAMDWYGVLDL